ncbi:CPBP family intramembrane metalloprotease [Corallococcus sp. H22C18031201]|nr:CPBP family intramembrane metalloprotease [Corallococcus sp. H22C18031201]
MEETPSSAAPLPESPAPLEPLAPAIPTVIALALFIVVGGAAQLANAAFGVWFTEVFIFLGLGWVFLRAKGFRPAVYTGLLPLRSAPTLFGFAVGVANFFALVVPIQYAAQQLVPPWMREMFDASHLFDSQSSVEMALILGGVTIGAPLCEEFFFRGILQKGLTPPAPASATRALVITAVIFSAFHLDPVGFLARVELGLLFGWLYLRTGSLWPGMAAHAANNLVSTVLYLIASRTAAAGQAEAETTDPRAVLGLALVGALGLLALKSVARFSPSVWGRGGDAPLEEARAPGGTPSLPRLVLPWVVASTVSLVGLGAVDKRGVALSLFDVVYPLPKLQKDAAPGLVAERAALKQARAAARRGSIPMEAYEEERRRQSEAYKPKAKLKH